MLLVLFKIKVLIYQYIKFELSFLLLTELVEFSFCVFGVVEIILQIGEGRDTSSANSLYLLQT